MVAPRSPVTLRPAGGGSGLGGRRVAAYVSPRSIQPGCICATPAAGWVRALTLERPLAEGGARGPRRSLGPQPSSDGLRDRPGLNGAAGEALRLPAPKPPSVRPRAGQAQGEKTRGSSEFSPDVMLRFCSASKGVFSECVRSPFRRQQSPERVSFKVRGSYGKRARSWNDPGERWVIQVMRCPQGLEVDQAVFAAFLADVPSYPTRILGFFFF